MTDTATEFDVRHTSSHPLLLGISLMVSGALFMAVISPSSALERAEDRIAHYSTHALETDRISDVSDRLSRGRFTFNPDDHSTRAERIVVLDLGHGIAGLCAKTGAQLRSELLLSEDLLSRPAFDRPDLNESLSPICQKALA